MQKKIQNKLAKLKYWMKTGISPGWPVFFILKVNWG